MGRQAIVRKTPFAERRDDGIWKVRALAVFEVEVIAACVQCAAGSNSIVTREFGVAIRREPAVGAIVCDYRARVQCELCVEAGPPVLCRLAIATAGRCRVARVELEEYVVAVVVTRMAKEDEEATGRLQY